MRRFLLLLLPLFLLSVSGCEPIVITIENEPDYGDRDACTRRKDGSFRCPSQEVEAELRALASQLVGDRSEGIAPNLLDLPPELRTRNYAGGSCAHAAIIDVLKWHGFYETAEWWRGRYSGAFSVADGARVLERLGFRYAYTVDGDEELLEWCSCNGHGAAIHYYPSHAITFRGYAGGYAILQDNNRPDQVIRVEKKMFLRNWHSYGGAALTLVYSPGPPVPTL